ncbi:MAG: zf-HC2 domain-containing protein [Pyrinomonadaceae bacterium]|nr:zf-HC2 domain-containing protein [Pyrinomonadaceae bacterium]
MTDYIDDTLKGERLRAFAEHALRCPISHELLGEVKQAVRACHSASMTHAPSAALEARILQQTMPGSAMTCEEFEEHLTDYLDGFLAAPLYHRWERHAVLCSRCTDLPGQVVRSIGACYSYISEEKLIPVGLHERILQATIGTVNVSEVRPSVRARLAESLRSWLDSFVSPQLATVATMILVAVLVGTSTISDDGTISGMYRAGLRMATQTYVHNASAALPHEFKKVANNWMNLVGPEKRENSESQEKK